jgi:O-antigen/teichoic acid export membrane protein
MSLCTALALYLASDAISNFFSAQEFSYLIPWYVLILLIRGISIVPQALCYRELKFRVLNLTELSSYIFGYGLAGILFAYNNLGVWSLVFAYIAQATIKTATLSLYIKNRSKWGVGKLEAMQISRFGAGDTLGQVANFGANQLDNILIGKLLGVEMLGAYGRAYQITIMPVNMIGGVIQKTLFPAFSRSPIETLGDLIALWGRFTVAIGITLSVFTYFNSETLVKIILGPQWVQYIPVVKILSIGILFRLLLKFSDAILRAKGYLKRRAIVQLAYATLVSISVLSLHGQGITVVCAGILGAIILVSTCNCWVALHNVTRENVKKLAMVIPTTVVINTMAAAPLYFFSTGRLYLDTLIHAALLTAFISAYIYRNLKRKMWAPVYI